MPFDVGEQCWKIRILGRDGISTGLLEIATLRRAHGDRDEWLERHEERTWRGRPQPQHFETLYKWKEYDGEYLYFVLIHFADDFTDRDYGREFTHQQAVDWLENEGYELPEDLQSLKQSQDRTISPVANEIPAFPLAPLTEALREVWDRLENRCAIAKGLAKELLDDFSKEDVIRKRVEAIRKTGRGLGHFAGLGYFRPDAPPPQMVNQPVQK